MKSKSPSSILTKRLLITFGVALLPLLVAASTQARNLAAQPAKVAIVSPADGPGSSLKDDQLKARLLYLISHNPKALNALAKSYGCPLASPQDLVGFWGCMKGCMGEVGISAYAMIMCGVACAAAGTGIGALACAVCVGVSVTVIEACGIGCGMQREIALEESQVLNFKRRHSDARPSQARLRRQLAKVRA